MTLGIEPTRVPSTKPFSIAADFAASAAHRCSNANTCIAIAFHSQHSDAKTRSLEQYSERANTKTKASEVHLPKPPCGMQSNLEYCTIGVLSTPQATELIENRCSFYQQYLDS